MLLSVGPVISDKLDSHAWLRVFAFCATSVTTLGAKNNEFFLVQILITIGI